jgi:hypothetical protein
MSNPFQEHADNVAEYEAELKGDDNSGGATLTLIFPNNAPPFNPPLTVDCRFERIIDNWELNNGQSPKMMVPQCRFLAAVIPAAQKPFIRKPLFCVLKPNPDAADVLLRLDAGGLLQGGLEYEFVLLDRNWSA